ncbi:MAG: SET domain-containing protein-lysine N-methyltransferase [Leptospira sp.]|nr:SET domain-containing protein-lysine N-methyltransferase [Leptospira sp.]
MKHKSAKKNANNAVPSRSKKPIFYSEQNFEIKQSKIPGIGQGLFTKVNLKKGDNIGYYTGKILTDDQAESNRYVESKYLLWICKDHWIYGEGKLAGYTRYINHSSKPNIELVTSVRWKTARFRALKSIKAGEELFFDYGPEYWENMDFDPK